MPKLPFAGYTSGAGGISPGSPGPTPRVPAIGADVASATAQFGQVVGGIGETMVKMATEREQRRVQVETAKASASFAQELNTAVQSGADFAEVGQRHLDRLDQMGEGVSTAGGRHAYEVVRARAEGEFGNAIMRAEAKRTGLEAKTQTRDMTNILGAAVMSDPNSLEDARGQMADFIGSFSTMAPEMRDQLTAGMQNELTVAAVEGMLRDDPLMLQEALTEGAFEDLEPAQRASFLGQTDSELRRQGREAQSQDELAKLQTRIALDAEAQDHVLTTAEAPDWFARDVTAGQYNSAMAASVKAQDTRDKLDRDVATLVAGGGATLKQNDYEDALGKLTTDATADMEPADAAAASVSMRVDAAVHNGRADTKLSSVLNAGPAGGEATFEAGLSVRETLEDRSPELLAKMIDGQSRAWYNAYDFMTERLSIDSETARGRLFETAQNLKDTESRLGSKENRELIADVVDVDYAGQNMMVKKDIGKKAAYYMALVPTMTSEQAVELAAKDFESSTVELPSGIRAPAATVPVKWEPAERYVRHVALERDFKANGVPYEVDELDDMTFFPNGDGTVAIIGTNGLTIFPRWDWQGAVDEWWVEMGQQDLAIENKKVVKEAQRREKVSGTIGQSIMGTPGL